MAGVEREVKLSANTTVVLKPVNMFEQMQAETFAVAMAGQAADYAFKIKCAALASIRSLNGQERKPLTSMLKFQELAQEIDGGMESITLTSEYLDASGLTAVAQAGNEEATPSA